MLGNYNFGVLKKYNTLYLFILEVANFTALENLDDKNFKLRLCLQYKIHDQ